MTKRKDPPRPIGQTMVALACIHCGAAILRDAGHHNRNVRLKRDGPYCSKSCSAAHNPRMKVIPPDPARFWSKVDKTGECWLWRGAKQAKGYGNVVYGGRLYRANRLAYVLANGPLPDEAVVMHTCDNPPCVRPEHLRIGTHQENTADMIAKGRGRWGQTPRALRGAAGKLGEAIG